MWPNPQKTTDMDTFTEQIFNRKLHFLWSMRQLHPIQRKWPESLQVEVWRLLNNLRKINDLYTKVDILLLSDLTERTTLFKHAITNTNIMMGQWTVVAVTKTL